MKWFDTKRFGSIGVALFALVAVAIFVTACGESPTMTRLQPDEGALLNQLPAPHVVATHVVSAKQNARAESRANLGEAGGIILIEGGHSLYFPPGSLRGNVEITAERVEGAHIQIKFGPHGLTFPADKRPVLTMNWASAEEPNLASMAIIYTDDSGAILEVLRSTIDRSSTTVTARLAHFSGYAIGH